MLQKFNEANKDIYVWVGNGLIHRDEAKVSVFDSVVQGGDAVWEGIRVYREGILKLDEHLNRLFDSAKALAFRGIPDRTFIVDAIHATLQKNKMYQDTHIRLTLTRGKKITSGMDPRLNQEGCTLIVLAEWKKPVYDNQKGIDVITSHIRRNGPQFLDSKIHHNNLLNNILAKIQANIANVDAALMLDDRGFAAELNGTNLFMIKNYVVYTPRAVACLPGITRQHIIDICQDNEIPCFERDISLTELYAADSVFCTGTMGELTPIRSIDQREMAFKGDHSLFQQIHQLFNISLKGFCTPLV